MWREISSQESIRTPKHSVKVFINLNVLDYFCIFIHSFNSKIFTWHKSYLCGEFGEQLGEALPIVSAISLHSTAFYCSSVTKELFAKKMLKSWVTFFLTTFIITSKTMLPWKISCEREAEKYAREMEAWESLIRLVASKERHYSNLKGRKLWISWQGGKRELVTVHLQGLLV